MSQCQSIRCLENRKVERGGGVGCGLQKRYTGAEKPFGRGGLSRIGKTDSTCAGQHTGPRNQVLPVGKRSGKICWRCEEHCGLKKEHTDKCQRHPDTGTCMFHAGIFFYKNSAKHALLYPVRTKKCYCCSPNKINLSVCSSGACLLRGSCCR